MKKQKKKVIYYLLIVAVIALVYFLAKGGQEADVELQVKTLPSQGREHVTSTEGLKYNSNPPTSGPHLAGTAKPGFYTRQIPDGNLIHNLEHGYVVINYDCSKPIIFDEDVSLLTIPVAYAHGSDEEHAQEIAPSLGPSLESLQEDLSNSPECQKLKEKLEKIVEEFNWKVIVQPRPENDHLLSLTAWQHVMHLDSFNEAKIKTFIRKYRNKGPEKTPN